jgi:hypothetical protein
VALAVSGSTEPVEDDCQDSGLHQGVPAGLFHRPGCADQQRDQLGDPNVVSHAAGLLRAGQQRADPPSSRCPIWEEVACLVTLTPAAVSVSTKASWLTPDRPRG